MSLSDCMLCAKKTILIEKNTTILQSMFVISKTIDTIDDLWLKRKQGLEWGILLLNFHSIFTFSSGTFFVVFLNPIFLFPKYISSKSFGRKKVEEMKRKRGRFFPPLSLLPSPRCFFLLTFLCTSSSRLQQTIIWG